MPTLSKLAPVVSVYINGRQNVNARVLSATMTSGGRQLPSARIVIEPVNRGPGRERVFNRFLAGFKQSEIEIVVGTARRSVIHWGKLLAQQRASSRMAMGLCLKAGWTCSTSANRYSWPITGSQKISASSAITARRCLIPTSTARARPTWPAALLRGRTTSCSCINRARKHAPRLPGTIQAHRPFGR